MGYLRILFGTAAALLFAVAGIVATIEGGDLDRTYTWLGLALAAVTVMASLPRPATRNE